MEGYDFQLEFSVRDYECDMQGVVNNAVNQNYLEHTRHEYLKTLGLDFAELTRRKIDLVVIRAELDYKKSLRGEIVSGSVPGWRGFPPSVSLFIRTSSGNRMAP